jgi:hypothetical protein
MTEWTHNICEACWIDTEGTFDALGRLVSVRRPVRAVADGMACEMCCLCAKPTISGIFIRRDPQSLNCSHH